MRFLFNTTYVKRVYLVYNRCTVLHNYTEYHQKTTKFHFETTECTFTTALGNAMKAQSSYHCKEQL